jgi:DNA-binding transcriptional LysR family regulator
VTAGAATLYIFTMADRKRTSDLDWQDVRYFVALARYGRLAATARALRVNHATVARRIENLEALLGCSLFERRPDGYALTAEGKTMLAEATAMDEAASALRERLAAGTEIKGLVRLTSPRSLLDGFLIQRLGALHERHPGLDLEFVGEARVVSLARRDADMALRMGSPKDSDLVARRLATVGYSLYASPAYASKLESGQAPIVIGYDPESDFITEAAWVLRRFPDQRFSFRSNSQISQAGAARAGYGLALLPDFIAGGDPALKRIWPEERVPEPDLWLLMRRDVARIPRIRAVADFLVKLFQRERKRFKPHGRIAA